MLLESKQIKQYHRKNDFVNLSLAIDKYLVPEQLERKQNAEISTPFELRKEMLDKIPDEFWSEPRKVFEPCCGKGGFVIDIVDRFMKGIKMKDKNEKYKTIVQDCLYFSDINPTNIFITKLLLDPFNKYNLNYNLGNTLELDIKKVWDLEGFDLIVSNPPYQANDKSLSNTIWNKFVLLIFNITNKNGYNCLVHPPGWRNVDGRYKNIQKEIFKRNLIYLEIHSIKDGIKTFRAGTRYDWYLLQNTEEYKTTEIVFQDGEKLNINVCFSFYKNGKKPILTY